MKSGRAQRAKVVVGMSGGVDSSVSAAILVRQGFEVLGVTLQTWKERGEVERPWLDRSCCKVGVARYIAEHLGITHQLVDAQKAFRDLVIHNFLQEYASGHTPNPCIQCNEKVKFGILMKIALGLGADYLATGHYARVGRNAEGEGYHLKRGLDLSKDQSYFLYRLNQEQLSRVIFPLGDLRKSEVWEMAEDLGLPAGEVAESQEICFVSEGDYRSFLREEMPRVAREGQVVGVDGKKLGKHQGVAFYTIGQRKGLGPALSANGGQNRLYVTGLNAKHNRVIVDTEAGLYRQRLTARDLNLIHSGRLEEDGFMNVTAKIRYRSAEMKALARRLGPDRLEVVFDQSQRAITPGQSVVLYDGEYVVGGGIIEGAYGEFP